jgi:hypothetical protein
MPDVKTSIIDVLSKFQWGHVVLVILMVLGTLVVLGTAAENFLPKAWKDKIDEIQHQSIVATILNVLRGFSYVHPGDWIISDPTVPPPAPQAPAK